MEPQPATENSVLIEESDNHSLSCSLETQKHISLLRDIAEMVKNGFTEMNSRLKKQEEKIERIKFLLEKPNIRDAEAVEKKVEDAFDFHFTESKKDIDTLKDASSLDCQRDGTKESSDLSTTVLGENCRDIKASSPQLLKESLHDLKFAKNVEAEERKPNFNASSLVSPGFQSPAKNKGLVKNNTLSIRGSLCSPFVSSCRNNEKFGFRLDRVYTGWDKKYQLPSSSEKDGPLIVHDLPSVDCLIEVHNRKHVQRLLCDMFNYDKILDDPFRQSVFDKKSAADFLSRFSDENILAFEYHINAVALLKLGRENDAKKEIKIAAEKGLSHGKYVYALITFKQIWQHNMNMKVKCPAKHNIISAIKYMIDVKLDFFPLPDFVLGIMRLYGKIPACKEIEQINPFECFVDILNGLRYCENGYILLKLSIFSVMKDKDGEYLNWVAQTTKYHLAVIKLANSNDLFGAKRMLKELISDGIVDAKCLYALELLKNTFGDSQSFRKESFDQAYTLLKEVVEHGYKDAEFFFGILPFLPEFQLSDKESQNDKGRLCLYFLENYLEFCGEDGEFKKDAAIFIAAEYLKGKDSFKYCYDEEKARKILEKNNCYDELEKLNKKLVKRESVLSSVMDALERVCNKFGNNEEQEAQILIPNVKQLVDELGNSELVVKNSPLLTATLELLHIYLNNEIHFCFAPLLQIFYILENVCSQPYNLAQKKILFLLKCIYECCIKLQIEHWKRM